MNVKLDKSTEHLLRFSSYRQQFWRHFFIICISTWSRDVAAQWTYSQIT